MRVGADRHEVRFYYIPRLCVVVVVVRRGEERWWWCGCLSSRVFFSLQFYSVLRENFKNSSCLIYDDATLRSSLSSTGHRSRRRTRDARSRGFARHTKERIPPPPPGKNRHARRRRRKEQLLIGKRRRRSSARRSRRRTKALWRKLSRIRNPSRAR